MLLANGVPLKHIQEWLGHSDFTTTANIYAHLDYKSKITSAQAMEQACSAGGRRLQQPLEFDQCRGEQLIFSLENRKSCGLCPLGKIKKPVNGLVYRLFVAES